MKKKIIITSLIVLVVVLLALATCKTTHAYTTISNNGSNCGVVGLFDTSLSADTGNTSYLDNGDNVDFQQLESRGCYYYVFRGFTSSTNVYLFILNFYNISGYNYMEVLTISDDGDTIINKYTYQMPDYTYIYLCMLPGYETDIYLRSMELSPITTNTQSDLMSLVYTDTSYDLTESNHDIGEAYILNTLRIEMSYNSVNHSNLLAYYTELDASLGYNVLFDRFNNSLSSLDKIRKNGFNYGYRIGEIENYPYTYEEGFIDGYHSQVAYHMGFLDGQAESVEEGDAINPVLSVLTNLAAPLTAILSIRLAPNITIGTIILIPLIFGLIGLVLFIWRRR